VFDPQYEEIDGQTTEEKVNVDVLHLACSLIGLCYQWLIGWMTRGAAPSKSAFGSMCEI
jgi:hypothetical protein